MASKKSSSDKKIQELKKKGNNPAKQSRTNNSVGDQNPFVKVDFVDESTGMNEKNSSAELEQLKKENQELNDKNLRLLADMQNVMRQHDMDIAQAKKSTKKEIAFSFLDFVSNMNLAFSFAPQNESTEVNSFLTNLKSSLEKSLQNLQNYNIHVLVPEPGSDFDPEVMTAINEPPEAEDHPKIKGVVSAGLRIEGQVVKAATVTF